MLLCFEVGRGGLIFPCKEKKQEKAKGYENWSVSNFQFPQDFFFPHLGIKKEPHVKTDGTRAQHCLPENRFRCITAKTPHPSRSETEVKNQRESERESE